MDINQEKIVDALRKYEWDNVKKLKNLLSDYIPTEKLHIRLVVLAYEEGVYDELKSATDIDKAIYRSVKKMVEQYGLSKEYAIWVVETWCYVIGIEYNIQIDRFNEKQHFHFQKSNDELDILMSMSNRESNIIKLQNYIDENPDDLEKEYELLGEYYGILVNPSFKTSTRNIVALANKCIDIIENLIIKNSYEKSKVYEFRSIRLKWIRSFLYMIRGEYIEAYDNYRDMVREVDSYLIRNKSFYGDCFFMYFFSELNIHIILETFGIDDEDFYIQDKEEIEWFKNNFSLATDFVQNGGWTLGTMTIDYDRSSNPFFTVFNYKGEEVRAIVYNQRTLRLFKSEDKHFLRVIPMGNGQFNGNNSSYTWDLEISEEIYNKTRKYLLNNRYIKEESYIHNCCGFGNR